LAGLECVKAAGARASVTSFGKNAMTKQEAIRPARIWALAVAALILVMVVVGGATRLTESGLSITEWKPISGVVPPLSDADWAKEFDAYKKIPQYAAMNADMTLDGFKKIFWWEWAHRLLARVIGAVFIIPGVWFWITGRLKGDFGKRIVVATMLLALEPIVGWWMVTSGLSERTEVAQGRLAIHLLIAAATFAALIQAAVGAGASRGEKFRNGFIGAAWGLVAVVFLQLGLGAVVAGLRAGRIYNDWPLMGGRLVPSEAFGLRPWMRSLFDDPATAQFDHRLVGYIALVFAIALAVSAARSAPETRMATRTKIVAAAACVQVLLGIVTLVFVVPLHAALAHQAVALILFGLAVANASATERDMATG
jgi:cytochrome c oxidase assembly protein subunit 15